MAAQLVVIAGPDRGMVISLVEGKPLQIGRGQQADVGLKDLYVSRLHCRVELRGDRLVITDLNSNAGTFINNQAITERSIRDGEFLQIGETHLSLRLPRATLLDEATIAPPVAAEIKPLPKKAKRASTAVPDIVPASPRMGSAKGKRPVFLPSERLHELSGQTLGLYEIGPLLGRGKSGLVFRALDVRKEKAVALKVLWPEFTQDDAEIKRFIRSMKTALPLRHPNIVSVYLAGKKGPYCYIAMKFISGESLAEMVQRVGGRVDWRTALPIGIDIARALAFAHERKIIHRNIAPPNVLIRREDGRAFLGDLFLAKAMEGGLAEHLTRPGEVLGDIRFMSPERLAGMSHVDHRSDIYSLGALLYTLVAGQPPFEGGSADLIVKVLTREPEDLKKLQPALPDAFNNVVKRMMAKRPDDRYQETAALLKDLEQLGR